METNIGIGAESLGIKPSDSSFLALIFVKNQIKRIKDYRSQFKPSYKNIFMTSKATTINDYIAELPEDRKEAMSKLRKICKKQLKGTEECMSYGMIGYVVPFKKYPAGYHCTPELPLPFVNIASQKNFIAVYHMGVYANSKIMEWFTTEYPKHCKGKLDMGKSCIRFKKVDDIPYALLEELMGKMSVEVWISTYEKLYKKK